MSAAMLAVLAVTVAVAAFVQGGSGFGYALIVAPVAGLIDPGLLPGFLLASMIPLNAYVAWRERSSLDLRGAGWISAARIVATPGGLALLWVIPESGLALFVGIATVLAAVVSLLAPAFAPGRGAYLGAGVVTGLTETATGVGGPPLALVYQHSPPAVLRSTVALCFLVGEIASLALLFATGQGDVSDLGRAAAALPLIAAGAWLSRLVHHRLDARRMRLFVLGFALVSGVVLML
ncbi:sulfite exporter TauE/SafE family protein [Streptomyces sp. YIM 130001]|uniref:sulfite exporter TauE/SafE family protein n=1 Tax=Streptomyces sp. YIM 130001 TaxID=2259644 RepID=UPI000E657D97|nr:sulfite exporter TauE/SafE family protein [Streptomyces sp. YIM 130001]